MAGAQRPARDRQGARFAGRRDRGRRRRSQAHRARRPRRQPSGHRRRDRKASQDVRYRALHVGGTGGRDAERARSFDPRAWRDRAAERGSRSGRGARAERPCWKASRRWHFRSALSTARFSSDRSRWVWSRPCSDRPRPAARVEVPNSRRLALSWRALEHSALSVPVSSRPRRAAAPARAADRDGGGRSRARANPGRCPRCRGGWHACG